MSKSIATWCEQYTQDTLSEEEMLTLAQRLDSDAAFREAFVEYLTVEAAIGSALSGRADPEEMMPGRPAPVHRWRWRGLAAAMLAGFICLGWFLLRDLERTEEVHAQRAVATLNSTQDAVWSQSQAGDEGWLYPGAYCLESGTASFTFDSGAMASVSGPAEFQLASPFEMKLSLGEAAFFVDEPAQGFTVDTPHATIVDLGTAFSLSVTEDTSPVSDVHVIDGKVQVASRDQANPAVYGAAQAVRVDKAGRTSPIAYLGDHYDVPRLRNRIRHYVHLPLDGLFRRGLLTHHHGLGGTRKIRDDSREAFKANNAPVFGPGVFDNALHFDGRGGGPVYSFSGAWNRYRFTISFWIRIPAGASEKESTFFEFQDLSRNSDGLVLSWNPDEQLGVYGALRFSYGSGYTIGSRPINDGAWHHITFTVVGGEGARLATHLRQYVDGRLDIPDAVNDGPLGPGIRKRERLRFTGFHFNTERPFRGAIDDIFLCGGLLLPHEIYALYQSNTLPADDSSV